MKWFIFLVGVFFFTAVQPYLAQAQNKVSLSTYYPAPSGNFQQIKIEPESTPPACTTADVGLIYYQGSTDNELKICDGSQWLNVVGPWQENSTDVYFSGGNVGIGIISPKETLHIQSTSNATVYINGSGGGKIILKDSSGTGCTMITTLNGAISPTPIACP